MENFADLVGFVQFSGKVFCFSKIPFEIIVCSVDLLSYHCMLMQTSVYNDDVFSDLRSGKGSAGHALPTDRKSSFKFPGDFFSAVQPVNVAWQPFLKPEFYRK